MGGERNAPTNYAFPNQRVTIHWLAHSPPHVSSFRTLGGAANTFANESFMDELAFAARMDPLEFRLRHLADARAQAVLRAAAERAGWEARPSPGARHDGLAEGRGLSFAQYENDGAIVACIADVQVDTASGAVRVKRIVAAHDCGLIINPDGAKNQIEGNIIQALSCALKEEVTFDAARVTSVDWQTYPILTFSEVPDVEVVLIDRPDQPALGVGEPASVTSAAAVANAIFDASGARAPGAVHATAGADRAARTVARRLLRRRTAALLSGGRSTLQAGHLRPCLRSLMAALHDHPFSIYALRLGPVSQRAARSSDQVARRWRAAVRFPCRTDSLSRRSRTPVLRGALYTERSEY